MSLDGRRLFRAEVFPSQYPNPQDRGNKDASFMQSLSFLRDSKPDQGDWGEYDQDQPHGGNGQSGTTRRWAGLGRFGRYALGLIDRGKRLWGVRYGLPLVTTAAALSVDLVSNTVL